MVETALQLDRSKSNPLFDNWKLAKGLSVSENVITLDRPVTLRDHSTDYLNTRAAVLHNHIHQQEIEEGKQHGGQTRATADAFLQPSVILIQGHEPSQECWLASLGHGDVRLIKSNRVHGTCFPLQSNDHAGGVRSLQLEAAFHYNPGQIQAVAWAIRQKNGAQPAACEIFLITMSVSETSADASLKVETVQLMQVSALPPHGVLVQPEQQSILIASANPKAEPISVAGPPLAAPRPAGHADGVDDDVDSVSPRTLKQAADRLAQFTSDQPAAETVPRNEFADMYSEVGPDNVGGMGDEPSCTITLFTLKEDSVQQKEDTDASAIIASAHADATAKPDPLPEAACAAHHDGDAQQSSASDSHSGNHSERPRTYVATSHLECDPHKLVALRPGQHNQLLLGLSNDVDCAVVAFSCSDKLLLDSQHLHSIPALAYVAAGKIHKKFTLLGHPKSQIAAAIVEGNRFSYVYKHTSERQSAGDSQIIDMGLAEESASVLGAALAWHDGQDRLLVVLPDQLHFYDIAVS